MQEGFWYSSQEPDLPMPVANAQPWDGQELFLVSLANVEKQARRVAWRGYSQCRICKFNRNGSATFALDGWSWPEGFAHYVHKHNVMPSEAFKAFILSKS